jgi:hypothetical protein
VEGGTIPVVVVGDDGADTGADTGGGTGSSEGCGVDGRVVDVVDDGARFGGKVGLSIRTGKLVGAIDDGTDGVEGGVMISVGEVGVVATTGASVVGALVVMMVVMGAGVIGKMGAGVGMTQVGDEHSPNMTKATVTLSPPKAMIQVYGSSRLGKTIYSGTFNSEYKDAAILSFRSHFSPVNNDVELH